MADISSQLQQTVQQAITDKTPLNITGSGSKTFLGHQVQEQPLSVVSHVGIINYQPTELVLTARAGTPLKEIEDELAKHGQILPFEPAYFDKAATLGGTIACGLSGSARPFIGSARDYVLGCKLINGHGQIVHFGGEVMKNVAGYDVSRLQVGAMGTLGVLLEISIKVLPVPASTISLTQHRSSKDALRFMQTIAAQDTNLTGLAFDGESVHIRIAGPKTAVKAAHERLGGAHEQPGSFWQTVNEQTHHFFDGDTPLWRLSLPPATPELDIKGKQFIDWAGALRWLKTDTPPDQIFKLAKQHGGHAQLFRSNDFLTPRMQPLTDSMLQLHQRIKASFDPHSVFNVGRMYPNL